jgi:hypothetical protein
MTFIHGKNTVVKVATKDLSPFTDSSELEIGADTHDTTTYGNNSHRKSGGLLDGSFKMSGTYDSTAVTGPRAALKPLTGTTVAVIRQSEGTGSGKPQDAFNAVVSKYVETSPVADMVKWSCEFEIDGDVNSAAQA